MMFEYENAAGPNTRRNAEAMSPKIPNVWFGLFLVPHVKPRADVLNMEMLVQTRDQMLKLRRKFQLSGLG